jgi:hypothetical protein
MFDMNTFYPVESKSKYSKKKRSQKRSFFSRKKEVKGAFFMVSKDYN